MIQLKPVPETPHDCPDCHVPLTAAGWLITGMRNLADLQCLQCDREFYGDLLSGQAFYTPILFDKATGTTYGDESARWFVDWLTDSYKSRTNEPLGFEIKKYSKIEKKPVLLNCLDVLYGHSLLKLLNAQYSIDRPDVDLIVLIPSFLEWLLPDGIAEAWIVNLPLRRGTEWNDWLAAEIEKRLEPFEEAFLSFGFSHPHQNDFDIERFTKVTPFSLENWESLLERPRITFIWREDRSWEPFRAQPSSNIEKLKRRFGKRDNATDEQLRKVITFAESLREMVPALDFAVAGFGEAKGLPGWVSDLRLTKLNAAAERAWCERYAQSHIVIGVHGSNMLLPSAHAGAVVELIDEDRWGNFLQDILFRNSDVREMFFRYRFVSHSILPGELSRLIVSVLRYEDFRRLMSPEFCRHEEDANVAKRFSASRLTKKN